MKQWLETRQVLSRLAELHAAGTRAALATVVRVQGSAYRHEGAKMVIAADGSAVGNVSGGCLEADVRETALRVATTGVAELRTYCGGSDEVFAWDLGVGCDGVVEILIEPVSSARVIERRGIADETGYVAVTRLRDGTECGEALRIVIADDGAFGSLGDETLDTYARVHAAAWRDAGESRIEHVGDVRLSLDVLTPPTRLVIVSAGEDARVLAKLADDVGFRTVVVDRRPALLARERFADTISLLECDATRLGELVVLDALSCCVVMTHDFADDTAYLRALLRTPARYIGMLGPRQRTERILTALRAEGPIDESRIYAPVGLDIGTDGAEQVALAVLAEILAVKSGRTPQSLRERRAPIHADRE